MKYKEIRREGIPSLSFMRYTGYVLYVGPKLFKFQKKKLKSNKIDVPVIYLPDIVGLLSKEVFQYNLPGVQWSENFSTELIYERIRAELGGQFTSKNRLLLRYEGDELVICDAGRWFCNVVSYLEQCDRIESVCNPMLNLKKNQELIFRASEDDDVLEDFDEKIDSEAEQEVEQEAEEEVVKPCAMPDDDVRFCFRGGVDEDVRFSIKHEKDEEKNLQSEFNPVVPRHLIPDEYYIRMLKSISDLHSNVPNHSEKKGTVTKFRADSNFDNEMISAARQVHTYIKNLLLHGFPAELLQIWINENVSLSRIRITKWYRIYLVDYDKEVKMGPLPMTVFIFFLRHPEGVRLSYLQDHVDELRMIYGRVSRNDDPKKMEASIAALVDPFNNSICEKCAAVKKAFMQIVTDSIARNYYITGEQGKKKGILLDRSLVEWECEL